MTLLKIFIKKSQKHTKTHKNTQSFKYKNLKVFFANLSLFRLAIAITRFFADFYVVFTSTIKAFLLTAGLVGFL
jgi:hypothetical protein